MKTQLALVYIAPCGESMNSFSATWINECIDNQLEDFKNLSVVVFNNDYVSKYNKKFINESNESPAGGEVYIIRDGIYSI